MEDAKLLLVDDDPGTIQVLSRMLAGYGNLRFATSGNFVYLPFENKFGIAGFGAIVPFTVGLEGIPAAQGQITWDTMIAGWNVLFADEFRISLGRFSEGVRDDFDLFEGGQFDEADTAGRYTFRAPVSRNARKRFRANDTDVDLLYYSNVASVTTERLLPGPVRLRIRAYHEDLWYNQGNRGQPSLREGVTVFAASERENLRFKPFLLASQRACGIEKASLFDLARAVYSNCQHRQKHKRASR